MLQPFFRPRMPGGRCEIVPILEAYYRCNLPFRQAMPILPVRSSKEKGKLVMGDLWILIAVVGGWFVLNRYILPKFGVST
jgi:hypothetical protein